MSTIPMLDWIIGYQKGWLRPDFVAGLTTAALVVPKAMAYATVAGDTGVSDTHHLLTEVFSTMNIYSLCILFLAIAPAVANAEVSLKGLKEGTVNAAKAVGEATGSVIDTTGEVAGKATSAVKDSVSSTKESLRDEATPEATRAKLDEMVNTTLMRLFAESPDSRTLFDQSAGYAVFDKREASFYVVAGYGRGVAVDRETGEPVYMKMATTGAGMSFGLGGFASQMAILFEDGAEYREFVAQGLDATAEAGAMTGDDKNELALRFNEGKAVFVLTGKGWKVGAKLTGSRYWPDEELNQR